MDIPNAASFSPHLPALEDALAFKEARDYPSSFLHNLHKLWLSKNFTDVVVRVKTVTFPAHRLVLCAASQYFQGMFTGGMSESLQDEVELLGIEPPVFQQLLHFIYTGELEVKEDTCEDLLAAADMLALTHVVHKCCQFLSDQLHPSNSIGISLFAERLGCKDLLKQATDFTHKYFTQVVKEEEFMDMEEEQLVALLHSEYLHVENEFQVFDAGMRWLLHNPATRRRHVFSVMAPVRFPIIPNSQLEAHINSCEDLSLKVVLLKMVQDFRSPRLSSQHLTRVKMHPYLYQPRLFARKSIYIIGGYKRHEGGRWCDSQTLSSVQVFSAYQQSWSAAPPLEQARSGHGVATLDGRIYVIGGESDSLIFSSMEVLDPGGADTWCEGESLTTPRCGLATVAMEGALYALGGWVGSTIGGSVERYRPEDGAWRECGTLPTLRFAMGVTACDGLIYVVGGMSELGTELATVESYNPVTNEWQTLPNMSCKRAYVGVAALDGMVYAVGGWNENSGALSTVERLNVDKGEWERVCSLSSARAGASVTSANGLLYALGGRTSTPDQFTPPATLATVECYDAQTDSWFELGTMPNHGRCEAGVVVM